jgi:pimeloyl-ACP methyl ester carboxylesterase
VDQRILTNPITRTLTTEDDVRIALDHYETGHKNALIVVHGFYNSKNSVLIRQMSEALCDACDVLTLDLRGHGHSGGRFTFTAKEHLDILAVLDFAKLKYQRIGILGLSLGAAAGIVATAKYKGIHTLVCVSPPIQFNKIEFNIFRMGVAENIIYNLFQEGRIGKGCRPGHLWHKRINPIDVIDRIDSPVFFIAGAKDWLIYPWHAKTLYAALKGKKELYVFPEGTHAEYIYRRFPNEFIALIKGWLKETLNI